MSETTNGSHALRPRYVVTQANNKFRGGKNEVSITAGKYTEEELLSELNKELIKVGWEICRWPGGDI